MAKNGTTLAERAFTAPGGVGAGVADQVSDDKLVRLFADGATMVLQALHRVWPPIIAFCQQLAAELGHPVQANAYVTPPQNQGFSDHYDVHDVFVLQIEGEKRWPIHAPVLESRCATSRGATGGAAVGARAAEPPLIEAVLQPGDCLYLPRGFLHAATALGGVSTHLTIGVHTWTRYALAEQLLEQALRSVGGDPAVRQSLPLGVRFDDPATSPRTSRPCATRWSPRCWTPTSTQVGGTLPGRGAGTSRAAPVGPLRQLQAAETLADETALRLREHLAATVETTTAGPSCAAGPASWRSARPTSPPVTALLAERPADRRRPRDWTWPGGCCWPGGRVGLSWPPRPSAVRRPPASAATRSPGTAPPARGWLLLEHPGPWRVDAVAGSGIEPAVLGRLRDAAAAAGARILLVRRPGRPDRDAPRRWSCPGPGRATVAGRGRRTRTCSPRRPR